MGFNSGFKGLIITVVWGQPVGFIFRGQADVDCLTLEDGSDR